MSTDAVAVQRLGELFGQQFDAKFLGTVLERFQGDLQKTSEYLLEVTQRTPGAPTAARPPAPPPKYDHADDLEGKDDMSVDGVSAPSTPAPTAAPGSFNTATREARRQQLGQLQMYLQKIGVAGKTAQERREFFTQNPVALSDMKRFLETIGLQGMNFAQLQEYFRQVGLSFNAKTQGDPARDEFMRQLLTVEQKRYEQYIFADRLSPQQKQRFHREGFLLLKGVVSRALVDGAVRDIHRVLGRGFPPDQREAYDKTTWCPELASASSVLDLLYESPALAYVMSLVGPVARLDKASISARFPGYGCVDHTDPRARQVVPPDRTINPYVPWPNWPQQWTLDGMPNGFNGVPRGQAQNFTCNVSVYLNEAQVQMCGNDVVFPGSHLIVNDFFRRQGGAQNVLQSHSTTDLQCQVSLGAPSQMLVGPGDVLITHYLLARCIAPNISPSVRLVVNFRVYEANHVPNAFRPDAIDDMWLEFDGLREIGVQPLRGQLNPLMQLSAAAALASAPAPAPAKRCASCQSPADAQARFCAFCGRPF